jgi:hypothetical protein
MIINTPQELFNLLVTRPFIVNQSNDLIRFRDSMSLYIDGCNCNKEDHLLRALKVYKNLNTLDTLLISELKETIPCDKIQFFLSETFIFEI